MKYMSSEWKGRLEHWMLTLRKDFFIPLGNIEVEVYKTMEHLTPEEALCGTYSPIEPGTSWGKTYEYGWMKGSVVLPAEAKGQRIVLDLRAGGEATVFVNGQAFGTYRADWVKEPRHFLIDNVLTDCGQAGKQYEILVEAYAGHYFPVSELGGCATGPVLPGTYEDDKTEGQRALFSGLTYGIWNEEAYQLFVDVDVLYQLLEQIDPESLRADKVAEALEAFTLAVDFEQLLQARIADYIRARELLKPVLEAQNGSTMPTMWAIGNAHLDLAWLWPMAETHRKTARTFAAQLRHLAAYPEYKFLASQPAAYEMCKAHYPELYERILSEIQAGRWIAEGAMWVEPDTNITSGESLIRQLLYGKRYFREEFGVDSVILWLPDTFGYSAALPQILKGCGVKYLVTQKIFWSYNDGDAFPYHYFTWQGADGSKIDTFLPTSYTYRTDPKELCQTWAKRAQKRGLDAFMLPFGYGDGGGGPCRDHIEYARRVKDLEGVPKVVTESPVCFFEQMEKDGGPKSTYVGELYFNAHRGVYTSQAAVKKGNRKCEVALREAELWGALAMARGRAYPFSTVETAWKRLLLNQFHDILPGSSIARVNEEAHHDHAWIMGQAREVLDEALGALTSGDGYTVYNSLSFAREEVVRLSEAFREGAMTLNGEAVPVQAIDGAALALVRVPSCGAVSLMPSKAPMSMPYAVARLTDGGAVLENEHVYVTFNAAAEITSYVDKQTGREFVRAPMNRLLLFKDVPRIFDAWDIDSNYEMQPVVIDEPVELKVSVAHGLCAMLVMERSLSNSTIRQEIRLRANSRRVDFDTRVHWNELHRLLKVSFPVDVRATEAINEIQHGYLTRPTHRSRAYDADRFEVPQQRYSALVDQTHGAAVLNDCKYGISQREGELQLTLLRAGASPEMRADNGEHSFTYAFIGWEGPFAQAPVVREAYALNTPLVLSPGCAASFSALSVDVPNVFVDAVKPAEDGSGDVIVRMYEAMRGDTLCHLTVSGRIGGAWLCDMLENKIEALSIESGLEMRFHPFEVKTIRLHAWEWQI